MKPWRRTFVDIIATLVCATILVSSGWLALEVRRNASRNDAHIHLKSAYPNVVEERALAEIYWSRHHDVKTHPQFGEAGGLGVYGARAHYLRFGKSERRLWPDTKNGQGR